MGRYVRELVVALREAAGADDAIVMASTPEPQTPKWTPPRVQTAVVPWPRRPVHAAWLLGVGPLVERSLGHLDVVHLLFPFPPARTAAPQVVTVHDVMPFEHPEWYPRSERAIYRRAARLTLRRASRIVVPSAYVAARLSANFDVEPGRITVVPQGVSGVFAYGGSSADVSATCARVGVQPGRFAISVGAVSTRKNLIPLIHAMRDVGDSSFPLVIVGPDGFGAEATHAAIAQLGDAAQVRRTGYLPDEEVAALVKAAAVLVHPALEEGFGFVPLEAMAAGTPVIAARVSSIPEVVGGAALLIDEPTEPAAWAKALAEVLGSDERRLALVAAGEERVSLFRWKHTAGIMLDIYRDVSQA